MRTPAKILLAGTFAATLPCAAATSQTLPASVLNEQYQSGDVFAGQTLDVEVVEDGIAGSTVATGNSADFTVEGGDLDVRSDQTVDADVTAQTDLNVTGYAGDSASLTTAATGNTGDAGVHDGTLTSRSAQLTAGGTISATSSAQVANGGDFFSNAQAIGNSQGLYEVGGAVGARASQTNLATIEAVNEGRFGYTWGQSDFVSTAAGNNVTMTGGGSGQRVITDQSNEAESVQANAAAYYGNVYISNTQATATGNNVTATEESPVLDLTSRQQNIAYLRAEAASSGDLFGAGTATAYGIGNSIVAGNVGPEIQIDVSQLNDGGGVDAYAEYVGGDGYDATGTATAMGNAATGYACSDCVTSMGVNNRQTNNADVTAESRVTVRNGRRVTGVATAVGNTASYYVSRPSE
jgi:hypothetical protein